MLRRPHVDMRAVSHLRHKIAVLTFADLSGLTTGYMETNYQAIYEQLSPLQLYRDIEARLAELWRLEVIVRHQNWRRASGPAGRSKVTLLYYDAAIPSW
jgi:hypothetical protein